MRRIVSLILVLILAIFSNSIVFAENENIFVNAHFPKASYKKDDVATLTFSFTGTNSNPVAAADFEIEYDSAYLSVAQNNKIVTSYTAGEIIKNSSDLSMSVPKAGNMKVLFMDNSADRSRSINQNGVFMTIQFNVLQDIENPKGLVKLIGSGDFCSEALQIYSVAFSVDAEEKPTNSDKKENEITVKPATKKPVKVKGVKVKAGKKKVTVTWKKAKNAKKYRVKYSYKKSMKKAKFVSVKKTKIVIKKLKSGKKVYVQVQGVNGKTKGTFSKKIAKKVR